MAVIRPHYTCIACGATRHRSKFGFDPHADRFVGLPEYELQTLLQTFGGKKNCRWDRFPVSRDLAVALRDNLQAALNKLNAELSSHDDD